MRAFLIFLFLSGVLQAQIQTPLDNAILVNALDGNEKNIQDVGRIGLGSGTPIYRLHLSPEGSPTDAVEGIGFGDDLALYRSAAGTLTLSGNLSVTGSITGTGAPIRLDGANAWTGANSFAAPTALTGGASVGNPGLSFTTTGASATRTALSLRPSVDIMPYNGNLATIAGISPASGAVITGSGSAWVSRSGSAFRDAVGLGTSNSPSFAGLTLSGTANLAALTTSGKVTIAAPNTAGAVSLGGGNLYGPGSGVIRTDGELVSEAVNTTTLTFGTAKDTNLYRGAANTLQTDDIFVASVLQPGNPLGTAYGGLGMNAGGIGANQILYTSSTGVFGATSLTAFSRGLLGQTNQAGWAGAILPDTGAVPGTYGSTTKTPVITVDAKGRVTTVTEATIAGGSGGTPSGDAGGDLAGTYPNPTIKTTGVAAGTYGKATKIPALTVNGKGQVTYAEEIDISGAPPTGTAGGDLTGTYPNPTLTSSGVTPGVYGSASTAAVVTVDSKGRVTSASSVPITSAQDISTTASPTFAALTLNGISVHKDGILLEESTTLSDGIRFQSTGFTAAGLYAPSSNAIVTASQNPEINLGILSSAVWGSEITGSTVSSELSEIRFITTSSGDVTLPGSDVPGRRYTFIRSSAGSDPVYIKPGGAGAGIHGYPNGFPLRNQYDGVTLIKENTSTVTHNWVVASFTRASQPIQTLTTGNTIPAGADRVRIEVSGTSSLTLPKLSDVVDGATLTISRQGPSSSTLTLTRQGSDKINGVDGNNTTALDDTGTSVTLMADKTGGTWIITSRFKP